MTHLRELQDFSSMSEGSRQSLSRLKRRGAFLMHELRFSFAFRQRFRFFRA
ncbi:hypothetical protein HMPREF3036_00369 [Sutterella sp. KLE1602]|nr:hypothetical protein HMPREF3036_00369 [Sutterella sp. KLE1602]